MSFTYKAIIIALFSTLIFLVYKDLTYKIRYEVDPKRNTNDFYIGYKAGLESSRSKYFMEGYLEAVRELKGLK